MNTFIIYSASAGILLFDFLPLFKRVEAKEKVVYLALLAIGLTALTLNAARVQLPSIAMAFQETFTSIFGVL